MPPKRDPVSKEEEKESEKDRGKTPWRSKSTYVYAPPRTREDKEPLLTPEGREQCTAADKTEAEEGGNHKGASPTKSAPMASKVPAREEPPPPKEADDISDGKTTEILRRADDLLPGGRRIAVPLTGATGGIERTDDLSLKDGVIAVLLTDATGILEEADDSLPGDGGIIVLRTERAGILEGTDDLLPGD
jgi:hypothetical protein